MPAPAPATPEIHRGLAGVAVDTTAISTVIQETNSLTYRGYPVQDLAARCSFEEVAYLLRYGELPGAAELKAFEARERALRPLDRTTAELLARLPETCHPMDVLRTAVSFFGSEDPTEEDDSTAAHHAKSLALLAKCRLWSPPTTAGGTGSPPSRRTRRSGTRRTSSGCASGACRTRRWCAASRSR